MSDDGRQTSGAPEPKQADVSTSESPFSMPEMEEIGKPLLPWRRKKRYGKRERRRD
jgi:hypothetical protein